jgi:hypothetical protein
MADTEKAIWDVVSRKSGDHDRMKNEMRASMARAVNTQAAKKPYVATRNVNIPAWIKGAA